MVRPDQSHLMGVSWAVSDPAVTSFLKLAPALTKCFMKPAFSARWLVMGVTPANCNMFLASEIMRWAFDGLLAFNTF